MAGGAGQETSLVNTPTWTIASTCAVFILSSLIAERTIYFVGHLLVKHKLAALHEAFEKVKEELMMVGFISIALTLGQSQFSKICVPKKWTTTLLLCKNTTDDSTFKERITLAIRGLQETAGQTCKADHTTFISSEGLHQLHIFVFLLVTLHVVLTLVIVTLGIWTVSRWKTWEERANIKQELSVHDGVRLTRETTFMRAHIINEWKANTFLSYVVAFFNQFFNRVSETDYHTVRNGFIKNHMPTNTNFNFYKYIRRSLQEDFKYVVGISPGLWGYALLWLLLNVDGWESNIIISAIPLFLILAIGTKLQHVFTKMAVHFNTKNPLTIGLPNVKPNDKLFWFNRPRFILLCIHFILFQIALELAFDVWAAITFPPNNCLYRKTILLAGRIVMGLSVQTLCGIITLPAYALVSQMGSNVKKTVFKEHIHRAIRKWHKQARKRVRLSQEAGKGSLSRCSRVQPVSEMTPPRETASSQVDNHVVEMVLHAFPSL